MFTCKWAYFAFSFSMSSASELLNNCIFNLCKTFLVDKSFVKLRDVVISYSLPKKWMDKTPFGEIQISLIGRNLLIWTPSSNTFIDPEITTFGNDLNAEYGEFSASPSTRSYGVSLKLTF